jgi:hypothetical protein
MNGTPNNGMHPTRISGAFISNRSGRRVMPGVSRFALRMSLSELGAE